MRSLPSLTIRRFSVALSKSALTPYLVLSLWVGLVLLLRSPLQSLMPHDEGWYAQQARWIVMTGDWVTQQWWGEHSVADCGLLPPIWGQ